MKIGKLDPERVIKGRTLTLGSGYLDALDQLVRERQRLLRRLGPVLRRVGHAHPNRQAVNGTRAATRKRLRTQLRQNAEATAAYVASLPGLSQNIP